jgi:hypothetical protein
MEALDGTAGSKTGQTHDVGMYTSGIMNGKSQQVYYYDRTNGSLRHMWYRDGRWKMEVLDGTSGSKTGRTEDTGLYALGLIEGGQSVYYYNLSHGSLRHMWYKNGSWHHETIDGTAVSRIGDTSGVIGLMPAVYTYKGVRYVLYYNSTSHVWKVAQYDSKRKWRAFSLDGAADGISKSAAATGGELSISQSGKTLHVFYQRTAGGSFYHGYLK